MKCTTVRKNLAGYLDDALIGEERVRERAAISKHLDACSACREELQRFRKLSALLSRVPKSVPPADLAIRIKVAASQAQQSQDWQSRFRAFREHAAIVLENVFRPLTVPATGGFVAAMVVFVLALQMIVPGTTVRAVENDVPVSFLRPAQLVTLSDYPQTWAPEPHDLDVSVDVTVDEHGHMTQYEIVDGPNSSELRHQLDQMLLFSSFSPMLFFGRPTPGGHVVLSISAVRVRG